MPSYTVTTSAQELYRDGLNDSLILRNDGPYTVYVDNDATVNAASHAIPPTGVMPWDSLRPLYVSLDPSLGSSASSSLTIIRNSSAAFFTNKIDNVLLHETWSSPGANVNPSQATLIEATAYETLTISVASPQAQINDMLDAFWSFDVLVYWYDSAKNLIERTSMQMYPPMSTLTGTANGPIRSRMNIPVKGTFVSVSVAPNYVGAATYDLRVLGNTRSAPDQMAFGFYDTSVWSPDALGTEQYVMKNSVALSLGSFGKASYGIYLPTLSNKLRVSWTTNSGTTVAGSIIFGNPLDFTIRYSGAITIPAGAAGASGHGDVILPQYEMVRMLLTVPLITATPPALMQLHLTWYDFQ